MSRDVIISIKGRQFIPELNDSSDIELVTAGKLAFQENQCVITYPESELTGLDGSVTTLLVGGGQVTMLRTGEVTTHMVFEQGRKHLSMFDTEFGALTVGVSASKVKTALTEQGGSIEMEYALEIDHAVAGENTIQIDIRESGPNARMSAVPGTFIYDKYLN